jgi:hypothetical protein
MSQNTPGPSRALEIQVPCIVFLVITPAFVAIRLWSRFNSKSGLGGDDWTILASTVSSSCVTLGCISTLTVSTTGLCNYCYGIHARVLYLRLWPTHRQSYKTKSENNFEGTLRIDFPKIFALLSLFAGSMRPHLWAANLGLVSSFSSAKLSTSSP